MTTVGWDIGGANLKQATADGRAWSVPFELWRRPNELAAALKALLDPIADETGAIAVTVTGELADCFATKAEGVDRILSAAVHAAGHRPVAVWSTAGAFVSADAARLTPMSVAAANWHALATWVGQCPGHFRVSGTLVRDPADPRDADRVLLLDPHHSPLTTHSTLLIDIGSTTTDIIPIVAGRPGSCGLTDVARLQAGELIYTGVRRTPLCALSPTVEWRGITTPVAAELFATSLDVYLLTGDISPDENDVHTANGQPATIAAAHDRMARMVCCDRNELPLDDACGLARQWAAIQQRQIAQRMETVIARFAEPPQAVILSGSGEFLAQRVLDGLPGMAHVPRISLAQRLGLSVADAACAFAVAALSDHTVSPGQPLR